MCLFVLEANYIIHVLCQNLKNKEKITSNSIKYLVGFIEHTKGHYFKQSIIDLRCANKDSHLHVSYQERSKECLTARIFLRAKHVPCSCLDGIALILKIFFIFWEWQ